MCLNLAILDSSLVFVQFLHRSSYKALHRRCNLVAIGLRLDVLIACDGLQQKFQYAEYLTCDTLIFQPVLI